MNPAAIFRTAGIRVIEARHADAHPPLMERAGKALADAALEMLGGGRGTPLIVAGPGNNGGDGFVCARLLKARGIVPALVFAGAADRLPDDARAAHDAWLAAGGKILPEIPDFPFALAVDALFGIGLARPLEARYGELVEAINGRGCPVLAVDIPSGLCADTGRILGNAVRASRTITFIALKPGLLTLDGPDCCGDLRISDLGLDAGEPEGRRISADLFRNCLRPRLKNSHKGSFGTAGILGGAKGYAGAALLAGRAALRLGAGRVLVGMLERLAVDPAQPELMLREAGEVFGLASALAVGPGLGQSKTALDLMRKAVDAPRPLVVDADGLNLLAEHPVILNRLSRRQSPTILTPHPLEAARLLKTDTTAVQADRVAAALELARRTRAHVALKGCGTILASPDGQWAINATGNPGLASAGSGDALAGIAVALLAQGWPVRETLACAVHLHGAAADALVARGIGPVGLAAGELVDDARALLNRWIAGD
ncbi:MAG: NAD(P)H-hydrate dehydratase [Candidatus Nitricoxidivorans perseverans]|uniref:Bifunctional NAD(P)H-hydrate repair enzyme n=1 Tax=Candidatus Nitricoxidivorans perseverans TaxID=2975601 RepID=A0AA49IYU5_9PROT|nr:MAG: NAD(P)H-hydrate dehydratase [Candidatus Nitricoxidivorans perseverans]